MKLLCCGDRHWTNKERIKEVLQVYPEDTVVIEGECRGADILSKQVAEELGLKVIKVPANWTKYGKAAGHIRNKEMLDMKPEEVVCFHNDIKNSKGTKNCITQARQRGIKILVIPEKNVIVGIIQVGGIMTNKKRRNIW